MDGKLLSKDEKKGQTKNNQLENIRKNKRAEKDLETRNIFVFCDESSDVVMTVKVPKRLSVFIAVRQRKR